MRKDYTTETGDTDDSEIAFVDKYWTEHRVAKDGTENTASRIPRKEK